ncbi:hypothetical protein A4A49_57573, partial [Nicotiana attenuata]
LAEFREILMDVVSTKAPAGLPHRHPAMDVTRQDHAPVTTTLRQKPASVEFGRFRGDNPEAWIFQAERYFDFYKIEEDQRLTMASFYLDDEALEWIRFKQKGLESAEGRLAKLRQVTTVSELQGRFETIANETDEISEKLMIQLFIFGLREDIKHSVLTHEPKTPNSTSLYHNPSSSTGTANTSIPAPRPPLKRLTHAELQNRRDRGLCYYCEQKYTAGHKCKNPPRLLLLTDGSDIDPTLPETFVSDDILAEELQCLEVQEHSAISYHALAGGNSSSTLRFLGHVNGSPIQVLVDGGSDHNFIQTRVADFLQLVVEIIPTFSVVVGSGQRLRCEGVVRQVPITIQGCNLPMDLYVLPLHGADVVLGTAWLATLGRVVTDYAERVFEFFHQGTTVSWKGLASSSAQPIQLHSLRKCTATDAISSYYCLQILPPTPAENESLSPALSCLLDSFADVFQKP